MSLPCEMIDEILCRLPVKFLLRYRCVSKEWCSLIDSDAFVKKHLKCKTDGVIICGDGKFFLTDMKALYDDDDAVIEINNLPGTVLSGAKYVGAANGLVCLSKNDRNEILLLNPSTRKYKKIPTMPPEFSRSFGFFPLCGFGYDHVSDDYKVVRIKTCYNQSRGIMVMVYSLKTNLWTQIQNFPSGFRSISELGKFASGALHWFAVKGQRSCIIVRLDLELEQFKELPCPAFGGNFFLLFPVGESLCIIENYPNSRRDVWLMNNHGAENPWYKAFSVEQPGAFGTFMLIRPVAFSRSGKDVLIELDRAKLMWYDLERKAVKNVRILGMPIKFDSHVYTESLLQLTEGEQLQKPSHDKKEKKQQKKRDDFLSEGFKLKL